jgi:putative tryptophan/tyrosine transport system substrate-binding protein
LPELAEDLVRKRVAVIAVPVSTPAALAAKAATPTIPIVFAVGTDPVALGLVTSLNRPGGNLTGISFQTVELMAKRLGLLRELAPQASRFVALINPNTAFADTVAKGFQAAATTLGLQVEILHAGTAREIEAAFTNLVRQPGSVLLTGPDPFLTARRVQIVTLAARHAIPVVHYAREFAEIGGLMSYGPNLVDVVQQTGLYTSRILKGEKPADLPVVQPTKFELVINLSTARALGLQIPDKLLALADEVIE